VNNSLGGLLYVIFWCLVVFFLFPRVAAWKIAGCVLVVTCLLECLQLYSCQLLDNIRSSFIGQAVLGNSFNPADFIYYVAGAITAYFWITFVIKVLASGHHSD
jgi:hypothetical protein